VAADKACVESPRVITAGIPEHAGQRSGHGGQLSADPPHRPSSARTSVRHAAGMVSAITPESCPSWAGVRKAPRPTAPTYPVATASSGARRTFHPGRPESSGACCGDPKLYIHRCRSRGRCCLLPSSMNVWNIRLGDLCLHGDGLPRSAQFRDCRCRLDRVQCLTFGSNYRNDSPIIGAITFVYPNIGRARSTAIDAARI
jgi:hypothetical protein